MKRRTDGIRLTGILIAAVMITVFMAVIFHTFYFQDKKRVITFKNTDFAFTNGYKITNDRFATTDNDPQIGMILTGQTGNHITVRFSKPVDEVGTELVEAFYMQSGQSEYQKVPEQFYLGKGDTSLPISIPEGSYSVIRVDVGSVEKQVFYIDEISLDQVKNSYLSLEACGKIVVTLLGSLLLASLFVKFMENEDIRKWKYRKKKFLFIDVVKAVAILMIIYFHFISTGNAMDSFTRENFPYPVGTANSNIATLGVGLFFLSSGATLMLSSSRHFSIKEYYKKRVIRIYLPFYLTYSIFYLFLKLTTTSTVFADSIPKWHFLYTILGADGYAAIYGIQTFHLLSIGEWFLGCILLMYLIFPLLRAALNKNRNCAMILFTFVYMIIALKYRGSVPSYQFFFLRLYDFIMGMYLIMGIRRRNAKIWIPAFLVIALILGYPAVLPVPFVLVDTLLSAAIFIFLEQMEGLLVRMPKFIRGKIVWISAYSLELFLVQHAVLNLAAKQLRANSTLMCWVLLVVEFLLIIAAAVLVHVLTQLVLVGIGMLTGAGRSRAGARIQ